MALWPRVAWVRHSSGGLLDLLYRAIGTYEGGVLPRRWLFVALGLAIGFALGGLGTERARRLVEGFNSIHRWCRAQKALMQFRLRVVGSVIATRRVCISVADSPRGRQFAFYGKRWRLGRVPWSQCQDRDLNCWKRCRECRYLAPTVARCSAASCRQGGVKLGKSQLQLQPCSIVATRGLPDSAGSFGVSCVAP